MTFHNDDDASVDIATTERSGSSSSPTSTTCSSRRTLLRQHHSQASETTVFRGGTTANYNNNSQSSSLQEAAHVVVPSSSNYRSTTTITSRTINKSAKKQYWWKKVIVLSLSCIVLLFTCLSSVHVNSTSSSATDTTTTISGSSPSWNTLGVIDGMVAGLYPTIRLSDLDMPSKSKQRRDFCEIRRIRWWQAAAEAAASSTNNGTTVVPRLYGKNDTSVPQEEGGTTVVGRWPDTLRQLLLITMLKGGHTTMGIMFDNAAHRLNATESIVRRPPKVDTSVRGPRNTVPLLRDVRDHTWNETLLFTVLRDPIDRFISSSCQDLMMNALRYDHNKVSNVSQLIDWTVNQVQVQFSHHQQLQISQLAYTMGDDNVDLPVVVVPFTKLGQLIVEMGSSNEKTSLHYRPRQEYTGKGSAVTAFCRTKSTDLHPWHLDVLCSVYRHDVAMLRAADIPVPLCDGKV